jgi:hypothetical protein
MFKTTYMKLIELIRISLNVILSSPLFPKRFIKQNSVFHTSNMPSPDITFKIAFTMHSA